MFRFYGLAVCAVMLAAALAEPARASLYTLENLNAGAFMIGQDNWKNAITGATSGSEAVVITGTGSNTTKAFRALAGNIQIARQNDADFSIPTFTGNEKIALEADFQLGTGQNTFALTNLVIPPPGVVAWTSSSSYFGFASTGSGATFAMNFAYRKAYLGAQTNIPVASVDPAIVKGDWVRMRLELDLLANGGDGSGSLFYKDLTLGQTSYTPIALLQNQAAGLLTNTGNKYFWDAMYLRAAPTSFDNPIDNLSVELIGPGTPEPGSLALFVVGLVAMATQGLRKRQGCASRGWV